MKQEVLYFLATMKANTRSLKMPHIIHYIILMT